MNLGHPPPRLLHSSLSRLLSLTFLSQPPLACRMSGHTASTEPGVCTTAGANGSSRACVTWQGFPGTFPQVSAAPARAEKLCDAFSSERCCPRSRKFGKRADLLQAHFDHERGCRNHCHPRHPRSIWASKLLQDFSRSSFFGAPLLVDVSPIRLVIRAGVGGGVQLRHLRASGCSSSGPCCQHNSPNRHRHPPCLETFDRSLSLIQL